MKKVYIIGAGGFAAELTDYIFQNNKINSEKLEIVGYFDIDKRTYDNYSFKKPFLGDEKKYKFNDNDNVLIAIGNIQIRKKIIKFFYKQKINFLNFVHYTSHLSSDSTLGIGNIICPYVIVGPNTNIGNFNLINYSCGIPHDNTLGNNNIFSPNCQLTGFTEIGNDNLFGVSTGSKPNIIIGNNNKIQPGIIVDRNIKNNMLVFNLNKVKTMELYRDE